MGKSYTKHEEIMGMQVYSLENRSLCGIIGNRKLMDRILISWRFMACFIGEQILSQWDDLYSWISGFP